MKRTFNPAVIERMANHPVGKALGPLLVSLLTGMNEHDLPSVVHQISFLEPGDEVQPGEILPTIVVTLQPVAPPIAEVNVEYEE